MLWLKQIHFIRRGPRCLLWLFKKKKKTLKSALSGDLPLHEYTRAKWLKWAASPLLPWGHNFLRVNYLGTLGQNVWKTNMDGTPTELRWPAPYMGVDSCDDNGDLQRLLRTTISMLFYIFVARENLCNTGLLIEDGSTVQERTIDHHYNSIILLFNTHFSAQLPNYST